ncbi:MAG: LytR C-terminal domain-containing protein [Bacteroidetes bacterium]|nr:LytR C-terminal domain-containing protein [Bacteroidota bacterium]
MNRLKAFGLSIFSTLLFLIVAILVVSLLVNIPLVKEAFFPVQVASSISTTEIESPGPTDIYQVEVRNGVGVRGVAERMRTYLRSKGYDVVGVGNHLSFDVEQTIIIDRIGNREIAQQVAASLGLPPERVQQDVRSEFHLDVSIILGKDYGVIPPFAPPQSTSPIQDSDNGN